MRALEYGWNALFERASKSSHLFQTFNWNWHWARIFTPATTGHPKPPELAIVSAHMDDKTILIFPLVTCEHMGTRIVQWMGDPVSQYGDILLDPEFNRHDILFQAWQFISEALKPDLIMLRKIRDDATIIPSLHQIGARVTETNRAPYLDLSETNTYSDYEKRYSAKARKNRRRHRKRLSETGVVRSHFVKGGPEAVELVAHALTLKRKWLAKRGLASRAFADNRTDQFFLAIANDQSNPVDCFVSMLTVDDKPAAIDVCVRNGDRVAAHIASYDAKFERNSPGSLQLEQCLAHCIESGIKTFDMMGPEDDYKLNWADYAVSVYDFILPVTMRGHAHDRLYLSSIRKGLTMLATRTPKRVRRIVSPVANAWSKK